MQTINQGEESYSNQGDPHGGYYGNLLWKIKPKVVGGKKLKPINTPTLPIKGVFSIVCKGGLSKLNLQ